MATGITRDSAQVLVGIDGSDSALDAVAWAADECSRRGRELHLVHCSSPGTANPTAIFDRATHLVGQRTPGLRTVKREITGPPVTALTALSGNAALVVIGHRGVNASAEAFAGSTASGLATRSHCPVVVVRPAVGVGPSAPVVVGLDGSPLSVAAAEFAFTQASWRQVTLIALMAWSEVFLDVARHRLSLVTDWQGQSEEYRRLLAEQLAGFRERFPDVNVERILTEDRPVRALLHEAGAAQLLVVGRHGRGGFPGMLLGSTSRALIDYSPCPLAIVRDPEHPEPDRGQAD